MTGRREGWRPKSSHNSAEVQRSCGVKSQAPDMSIDDGRLDGRRVFWLSSELDSFSLHDWSEAAQRLACWPSSLPRQRGGARWRRQGRSCRRRRRAKLCDVRRDSCFGRTAPVAVVLWRPTMRTGGVSHVTFNSSNVIVIARSESRKSLLISPSYGANPSSHYRNPARVKSPSAPDANEKLGRPRFKECQTIAANSRRQPKSQPRKLMHV